MELISKRLIKLAIEDEKYTNYAVRVAHSRGDRSEIFITHLQPYLNDTNPEIRNKALVIQKKIIEKR